MVTILPFTVVGGAVDDPGVGCVVGAVVGWLWLEPPPLHATATSPTRLVATTSRRAHDRSALERQRRTGRSGSGWRTSTSWRDGGRGRVRGRGLGRAEGTGAAYARGPARQRAVRGS